MFPRNLPIRAVLAALATVLLIAADDPKHPGSNGGVCEPETLAPARSKRPPTPPADLESAQIAQALRESWPDHPEWVDMLTAILDDEPMGPSFGWFRTAIAQTRFGWESTKKRYDKNADGAIARGEFPGPDADFARLDRDRDMSLTAADFDFNASSLAPSPGAMLFSRLDADGSGKITRLELEALFKAVDSDGRGFLSLDDLKQAFTPPAPRPGANPAASGMPSKATLVKGLFRQEIGSLEPGPNLDQSAPDFTLKTNDGTAQITLSKLVGPKPVVLVFGNFTCGPFRSHSGNIEKLYRRYQDRANFVMVYVREAHPTEGWRMESNDHVGVVVVQPKTYADRVAVARQCGKRLDLGFPMLVDTIDDAVGARYSGMPGRLYLIDRDGKIAFKSGRGPYHFKPAELEQSLVLMLQEGTRTATAANSNTRTRDINETQAVHH